MHEACRAQTDKVLVRQVLRRQVFRKHALCACQRLDLAHYDGPMDAVQIELCDDISDWELALAARGSELLPPLEQPAKHSESREIRRPRILWLERKHVLNERVLLVIEALIHADQNADDQIQRKHVTALGLNNANDLIFANMAAVAELKKDFEGPAQITPR